MCEAKVFLTEDHAGQPLMKDVVLIQPEGDAYLLANLARRAETGARPHCEDRFSAARRAAGTA